MEAGRIAIVARSAALAHEAETQLPLFGLGASQVVCLPANSANEGEAVSHLALLKRFQAHWGVDAVLLLGPIAAAEEDACVEWISGHMDKPVIGLFDSADAAQAQQERLRASGVHITRDAATLGAFTASIVPSPWLPFD